MRRVEIGQNGHTGHRKLGNGEPERLAIHLSVEHVVARVDEPRYLLPLVRARKVNDPVVGHEPVEVEEDEPHIASDVEGRHDRSLDEVDVEDVDRAVPPEYDRVFGNAELAAVVARGWGKPCVVGCDGAGR